MTRQHNSFVVDLLSFLNHTWVHFCDLTRSDALRYGPDPDPTGVPDPSRLPCPPADVD